MATKDQVLHLHTKHPDWNCQRIAEALHCTAAYVRATASRMKIKLPPKREGVDSEVYDLGLACRASGITLRDILDLAEKRANGPLNGSRTPDAVNLSRNAQAAK